MKFGMQVYLHKGYEMQYIYKELVLQNQSVKIYYLLLKSREAMILFFLISYTYYLLDQANQFYTNNPHNQSSIPLDENDHYK